MASEMGAVLSNRIALRLRATRIFGGMMFLTCLDGWNGRSAFAGQELGDQTLTLQVGGQYAKAADASIVIYVSRHGAHEI